MLPLAQSQSHQEIAHDHRVINKISALTINATHTANQSDFDIDVSAGGNTFTLLLRPNVKLTKLLTEKQQRNVTLLKGNIKGIPNSWARLSLKSGHYTGVFYDGTELYFIEPKTSISKVVKGDSRNLLILENDTEQVLYKASDVEMNASCALEIHNPQAKTFDYSALQDELSSMTASIAGRSINLKIMADTEFNSANNNDALSRMLIEMNVVQVDFCRASKR
ncbi:hypothetical protein RS130_20660 [Paraglaciecola aquimarina]|uniref:Uncharacterized protein n=1 Tax=Paraglaciecola aquimarina TaxID=1235557 RepID=A0ABU3T153_9ALTE|nr:reprolysin family propeptide-containing metallopeptidase [Paraglaciecola aquimarina]MDU0355980.1 hypothetical protein [Paraglaciecola aquimarina]